MSLLEIEPWQSSSRIYMTNLSTISATVQYCFLSFHIEVGINLFTPQEPRYIWFPTDMLEI